MTGRLGAGPDLADVLAERDHLRAQLAQAHAEAAAMREALERVRAVALEWQHQDCQRGDECDEAAWDADGETECAEHPDGDCPACSEECGRGLLLRLTDVRPGAGRAMLDRLASSERSARAWQERAMTYQHDAHIAGAEEMRERCAVYVDARGLGGGVADVDGDDIRALPLEPTEPETKDGGR